MVSIIVAFNKGREYLEDCFSSIKEQKYKDIETVLVLDKIAGASEETINDLIDKYNDDINLDVYELENKTGVSAARNLGIERAQGEYVYFLDSDDYVMEDTLTTLMECIEHHPLPGIEKNEIDLAYGKILHTWFKKAAFNVEQGDVLDDGKDTEDAEKIRKEDDSKFTDITYYRFERYDSIEDITALGVLYKKEFLVKNKIYFNEKQKYYADSAFWTKVANADLKYSYCDKSIYVKRYHNDKINLPSISQTEDEKRDEYFTDAYLESFKEAKTIGQTREHLEKIACRYFIDSYSRRFHDNPKDKPGKDNFEIITKIIKNCNRDTFKKFGLIEKNILKKAVAGDIAAVEKWADIRLVKKKIFMMFTSRKHLYRTINLYIFGNMKQKDNWIVFESFVGRNYSGQPKYIYQYLQKNYGGKYKYIWIVNDKNLEIDGKCKKVKRFRLGYYYYMTRSKFWVNNMRQPHAYPKRDSQIMLETWHGTPLKKLVFDMDDVHSANPKYKQIVYKQSRKWDYLLSDNPFSTDRFESCFMYDRNKILELGYPANDPLYAPDLKEKAVELKNKMGIPLDKKVLLYAPTWRDDNSYGAGEYKFELALDLNRLKEELGDEYVVLLRMHYWIVDRLDLTGLSDFVVNVSSYSDITDIYIVSDVCMTDYSSVFFDYANLQRPILFYMYDLEKYRDVLRGFYLDIEKELPGPILTDNEQVLTALKNIDEVSKEYHDKYQEFYDRFCCIDDGHAAERVCNKVFLGK